MPWPELRGKLNRQLWGWVNYFSFGFTGTADTAIWRHTDQRARRFLCKRHKLRPQVAGRFSAWEIYGSSQPNGVPGTSLALRKSKHDVVVAMFNPATGRLATQHLEIDPDS